MNYKKPVVCLGIIVADMIGGPLDELPGKGSLVLVRKIGLYPGGCAANTALTLARLGLPVELIGKVGQDPLGDFLLSALVKHGVGARGVCRDRTTATSATMVMIDPDGERRFVHMIGANAHLTAGDVNRDILRQAVILHVGGCLVMPGLDGEPMAELLRQAQLGNTITVLDTAWDATGRWLEVMEPCLPYIDYFVPSLTEARAITRLAEPEIIANFLIDRGVGTVALKMGRAGCLVMSGDRKAIRQPAYHVDAVDATGAGDAFAAGFITGIWLGWDLAETAKLANASGALCVTGVGGLGGARPLSETREFMETTPMLGYEERV